jgi:hypothetical protein
MRLKVRVQSIMDAYTPHRVASILRNGSDDPNEVIDVANAVNHLPPAARQLLTRYGQGFPPSQAGEGVSKSPKREYGRVVRMVTRLLNGGEEDDV